MCAYAAHFYTHALSCIHSAISAAELFIYFYFIHSKHTTFSVAWFGKVSLHWDGSMAGDRKDMMDVAWGLNAHLASVVASSTQRGRKGRDGNQTSHFPCSAHKYLCG